MTLAWARGRGRPKWPPVEGFFLYDTDVTVIAIEFEYSNDYNDFNGCISYNKTVDFA
jgi:hypothetical protein